jgi:hypothetical protein
MLQGEFGSQPDLTYTEREETFLLATPTSLPKPPPPPLPELFHSDNEPDQIEIDAKLFVEKLLADDYPLKNTQHDTTAGQSNCDDSHCVNVPKLYTIPATTTIKKMCTICGATKTPLWRKANEVTVCNKCGLSFRRKKPKFVSNKNK